MRIIKHLRSLCGTKHRDTSASAMIDEIIPPTPPPPEYPHGATIYIRRKLGPPQALTVDLNISLQVFKGIVGDILGLPVADQRIYQPGVLFPACGDCQEYKDDQNLGHYDVQHGDTVMIIPRLTPETSKDYSLTTEIFTRPLSERRVSVMADTNMLVLELKDLIIERIISTFGWHLEATRMRLVYITKEGPRELLNGRSFFFFPSLLRRFQLISLSGGARVCWRGIQQGDMVHYIMVLNSVRSGRVARDVVQHLKNLTV
ncbi:hypothetical protein BJX64DRAFT_83328 [Aspergillus heterothallicus]